MRCSVTDVDQGGEHYVAQQSRSVEVEDSKVWLNEAAEDLNVGRGKDRESLDKVVEEGISLKNRTVRKGRDRLKNRAVGKGKVNLDDSLNVEQGRVLMSTRPSLTSLS